MPPPDLPEALGQSEAFLDFQDRLRHVAAIDRPLLVVGERGVGKELAARRIHYLSPRWEGPLVTLNCAALAPTLIESELFGHERGAFTGAERTRRGRFEAADGGTLFLDELGTIPLPAQEKILRAVEYGAFERLGGGAPVEVDVRLVGATNADLPALVRDGAFRSDLLDRLAFEVLRVPPLRERRGDVRLLAERFAARMAVELGREEMPAFTQAAARALEAHPWPGNVRELKNAVERSVARSDGARIGEIVFDPFAEAGAVRAEGADGPLPGGKAPARAQVNPADALSRPAPPEERSFAGAVRALEVRLLHEALSASRHNQREAADRLGLTYHQFRGLYRKYCDALAEPET